MPAGYKLDWFGEAAKALFNKACEHGLATSTERLLVDMNKTAPLKTGTLRRTAYVTGSGHDKEIVYPVHYATPVHEHLRAKHPVGRAKWAELTLNEQSDRVILEIGEKVDDALGPE